ncbi:MAG: beta-ketoacyl-ACP synthase III [Sphingomonadales bacterium]|nr:beta-ketoacyl-ACP synthase III [Sphingomonadales bacterium]MBD3772478.1 beta-ketoacyl-ACP synthase III [Paracoccaceae bacterium]
MNDKVKLSGRPVISSTGMFAPPDLITNDELVASFNRWVDRYNAENAAAIAAGEMEPKQHSSAEFIEKASGIRQRHVLSGESLLDIDVMAPRWRERADDELSITAEMSLNAARQALAKIGRDPAEIDAVIYSNSSPERQYPAVAIEVQQALGIDGFAFDMNVGCSSTTFAVLTAADYVRAGHARSVLVVTPEIPSAHINWQDRDSHFIFGDFAVAVLVEDAAIAPPSHWEIIGSKMKTVFSNNIRNNFGIINRGSPDGAGAGDKMFVQQGRKVFKEVVPMVSALIVEECGKLGIEPSSLRRIWLHQANSGMNRLIAQRIFGHEASADESPTVLDRFGNTAAAGSIIAFTEHSDDLQPGDTCLICSFGAGYSVGAVFIRKVG